MSEWDRRNLKMRIVMIPKVNPIASPIMIAKMARMIAKRNPIMFPNTIPRMIPNVMARITPNMMPRMIPKRIPIMTPTMNA